MQPQGGRYVASFCLHCKRKLKGFVRDEETDNLLDFSQQRVVAVAVKEAQRSGWVCNTASCTETVGQLGIRVFDYTH